MQQRRLRLGDILDDYCPRERRITNHVIVAMVDEDIKQTRCTTCDADHEYKQARVPQSRRRRPEDGVAEPVPRPLRAVPPPVEPDADADSDAIASATPFLDGDATPEPEEPDDVAAAPPESVEEDWPVHRRLIRATLPRPEGQAPERKAPDFTLRQPGGRFDPNRNGGRHRGRTRQSPGSPGQTRFGARQGGGPGSQGSRHGNRPGNVAGGRPRPQGQNRGPRQGGGHGRKRGR